MNKLSMGGWIIICLSFIVAFLLTLLPLPTWAEAYRPDWVALVLLYWVIVLPHRIGLFTAWILGLLLDQLMSTLLGEHALALTIIAYIAIKMHRRIRLFPMHIQMGTVFSLLLLMHILFFWIQGMQGFSVSAAWFWASTLVSALLWPWVSMVLTDFFKRY